MDQIVSFSPKVTLPGTVLPWGPHPACVVWPPLPDAELRALAKDIKLNGLHEPITLTPDGLLLDGRNRALACIMAGVEPHTVIYGGDPWLFSLSINRHRRHMSADQLALVAATLATAAHGGDRGNQHTGGKGSNEPLPTIAKAAEQVGVTETAVKAAKAVLQGGTVEEVAAVRAGTVKVRAMAARIRKRKRAPAAPEAKPEPEPVKTTPARDPNDVLGGRMYDEYAGDKKYRLLPQMAAAFNVEPSVAREALRGLGDCVIKRKTKGQLLEYKIMRDSEADMLSAIAAKDLKIIELETRLAELVAQLDQLTAPAQATAPAMAMVA